MDSWGLALHADKIKPNHGVADLPNPARFITPSAAGRLRRKRMAEGDVDGANKVFPTALLQTDEDSSYPATLANRGENMSWNHHA